jgi:hypothetical protein
MQVIRKRDTTKNCGWSRAWEGPVSPAGSRPKTRNQQLGRWLEGQLYLPAHIRFIRINLPPLRAS